MSSEEQQKQITIEDFAKLDLRVGQVESAERVEGTKLLKLIVDLGNEKRQIISGIAKYYTPESIIGKKVVVIVNLKPRLIRGMESQGMILAAGCKQDEEKGITPALLTVLSDIPAGSKIC